MSQTAIGPDLKVWDSDFLGMDFLGEAPTESWRVERCGFSIQEVLPLFPGKKAAAVAPLYGEMGNTERSTK